MNNAQLDLYRENRKVTDPKFLKQLRSPFMFGLYTMTTLPMAFLAGCKVKHVDLERCEITVPFKWMNQNPFRSTYCVI